MGARDARVRNSGEGVSDMGVFGARVLRRAGAVTVTEGIMWL